MWANMHLLFWLSLVPFVTSWMGENHFAALPVALYGLVQLCLALSFTILVRVLVRHHGKESALAAALGARLGGDRKGNLSLLIYSLAIPAAFVSTWISGALYVSVAVLWLVPDRRITRVLVDKGEGT